MRVPGDPEHPSLPHDEGGGEEAGAAPQLQAEGHEGRVQRVQEAQGLQLHHAYAHCSDYGKSYTLQINNNMRYFY